MKESTRQLLEDELRSGNYAYETLTNPENFFEFINKQKDFKQLFELYLVSEFDDIDTFFTTFCHKQLQDLEFYKFIIDHTDDFRITAKVLEDNAFSSPEYLLLRDISRATSKVVGQLYSKGIVESKQAFIDIVLRIAGKGNLLEIGSGQDLPLTSLIFARELGHISSMDKFYPYWSSLDFFRKMGINATSGFFDENTNISAFQTITSQHACHGAVAVIDRLANNGGEQIYFQEMCDCPSTAEDDKMTNLLSHLRRKDSNLKSIAIKRTQLGQTECHVNGLDNDDGLLHTFVTNSPMHVDDIAQIICDRY